MPDYYTQREGKQTDELILAISNSVRLAPQTVEDARAMVEAMSPSDRAQVSADWLARVYSTAGADEWTLGYTVVRVEDGVEVGHCGFKGPPKDGAVEIAYGIGPKFQGRGYATETARRLVDVAFGSEAVRLVMAHTIERRNASARVLEKAGFGLVGEVIDPEDGAVWRWERRRHSEEPSQMAPAEENDEDEKKPPGRTSE